jgi:uncharacterized SAM-binding protein YcdF (DUF218 family)
MDLFVLKKFASHLLAPVPVCIDILLAGLILLWFSRRQKAGKVLVSAGTLLLALLGNFVIPAWLLEPLEFRYPPVAIGSGPSEPDALPPVKYIVVLSGGFTPDSRLPVNSQLGGETVLRIVEGIRLYREEKGSKLLMSGGPGSQDISQADLMSRVAVALGVSEKDILLESRSRDTEGEARLIRPIVGREPFILVTEAAHMPRAMALFRKQGMSPIAGPTDYESTGAAEVDWRDFYPDGSGLGLADRANHEYLGLVWEKLRGHI